MSFLPPLSLSERDAIKVLREFIKHKPEHTAALFKALLPPDAGKEMIVNMLQTGKAQLDGMLAATQGMTALARYYTDKEKESKE